MTELLPKLVYLARRRPGLTRAAFVQRWRDHGALAMSQSGWSAVSRYIHCDTLQGTGIKGLSDDYDGVGGVWFRSDAQRRARAAIQFEREAILRDEAEVFDAPVAGTSVLCREEPGAAGEEAPLRLYRFVWRAPSAEPAAFAAQWAAATGEGASGARRVVNWTMARHGAPPPPGLGCGLVEEFWFDRLDDLAATVELRYRQEAACGCRAVAVACTERVLDNGSSRTGEVSAGVTAAIG